MSEFTHTIVPTTLVRTPDNKAFASPHGKLHGGEKCKRLRALTADDVNPDLAKYWDKEVGQTVVGLEDGTEIVLLNDEARA